jgi:hypothetical protein
MENEMSSITKAEKVTLYNIVEDCTSPVHIPVIHEVEVWNNVLPNAYTKYMDEWKNKFVNLRDYSEGGMVVPFEVRDDPNKGRGLYAKSNIKNGTKVWTPAHFHYFNGKEDFLAFLMYLPHNLQCDIILWTYPVADTSNKLPSPLTRVFT